MDDKSINWRQFKALLGTSIRIETRGRSAQKPYRRMISLVLSYGIASLYLAWNLSQNFYEPAYTLITFTLSMFLAGFTVITSYSFILLDTADDMILQQFPVSTRTLFAVRSTNLFFYIFLISIPFYIPLAVFFTLYAAEPSTAAYLLIALFLATLWTTCLFLIFYNIIMQLGSNSTQIFSFLQVVFILLLLFFYQSLPSFDSSQIDWQNILNGSFPYFFPPTWFAALFWSLQGYIILSDQNVPLLLGSFSLILFLLLLRSPLLLLPKVRPIVISTSTKNEVRNDVIFRIMTFFRPRNKFKMAGYDLLRILFHRDRILQVHILPVLLMPIAVALYGLFSNQIYSPLHRQTFIPDSHMHIVVVTFYLFAGRHIIQTVTHSRFAPARWIFQMCDSNKLENYSKGVYDSIIWNILFPMAVFLFALFNISMPVVDALFQSCFLFLCVRFQTATWSVFQVNIPFSMYEERLSSAQRITHLLLVFPYIIILETFHWLASVSPYSFILFLASLELSTQMFLKYLHRKTYSVQEV